MDEKRVEEWAVKWIGENLDPRRWCYHHLGHVRDVVADAAEFGHLSGLPESELSLLRAAGWLHDTGYAIDPANHEEASARKAQEVLPQLGCTPEETLRITGLIRATSLEREPAELAERIMRDADIAGSARRISSAPRSCCGASWPIAAGSSPIWNSGNSNPAFSGKRNFTPPPPGDSAAPVSNGTAPGSSTRWPGWNARRKHEYAAGARGTGTV